MSETAMVNRLDRAVDETRDHCLGDASAPITLVEYGSYDCPHCRAANERIAEVRSQFGERLRYVFRHRPVTNSDIARRTAELIECCDDPERFWPAHVKLMTGSERAVGRDLVLGRDARLARPPRARRRHSVERAAARAGVRRGGGQLRVRPNALIKL